MTHTPFSPIPRIAIVGSGPAGCYAAQRLRKDLPEAEITIFDRLPVPYGLVRYGVAPDHQGTKGVTKQFDRLFADGQVVFLGNVRLGEDVELSELRELFDVVVLAIGRDVDAVLDIPDASVDGVYGAGQLTRRINSHPDEAGLEPVLGSSAIVVGHGNVAIDIVRTLIKSPRDWDGSDVDDDVHAAMISSLQRIELVGRSLAPHAKFDAVMIRELGLIDGVQFKIHGLPEGDPSQPHDARSAELLALQRVKPNVPRITVNIRFGLTPRRIVLAGGHVGGVVFEDEHGVPQTLDAQSVITAIGFGRTDYLNVLSHGDPETGKLAPGLFAAGWCLTGARGTIPENRITSQRIAAAITDEIRSGGISVGRPGRAALPNAVLDRAVNFADWRRIDDVERAGRKPGRVRKKLGTFEDLRAVARNAAQESEGARV